MLYRELRTAADRATRTTDLLLRAFQVGDGIDDGGTILDAWVAATRDKIAMLQTLIKRAT